METYELGGKTMSKAVKVKVDCDNCIHRYTCKYEHTIREFKKVIEYTCQTDTNDDVEFRILA